MQLMSWGLSRLGSRFSFLFEPYQRRVRHSALGRFFDRSMDLMVGLVEPDGTDRVLPFTERGSPLHHQEQFERINSITFRGFSERYRLQFEFNIHSVFYPQNDWLCLIPAYYLEMRVSPMAEVRRIAPVGHTPDKVRLFIRLDRPDTRIQASVSPEDVYGVNQVRVGGHAETGGVGMIDLAYHNSLTPRETEYVDEPAAEGEGTVSVQERIISLNPDCTPDADGKGLTLEIPVTEVGSGVKWRLVWGAHCAEKISHVGPDDHQFAKLRYTQRWPDLDAVMREAVSMRFDWLAHSRRFEKLIEQAPLRTAQRHLLNQSFQAFLSNTYWCVLEDGVNPAAESDSAGQAPPPTDASTHDTAQWFSVWDGSRLRHSIADVQYHASLIYLSIWPNLLKMQLHQCSQHIKAHPPSGGSYVCQDPAASGRGSTRPVLADRPVEDNSHYLLLLQAYAHWTGDLSVAKCHADLIERLATYLTWTDRDDCGFPSEGTHTFLDDATQALRTGPKQTYLGVKRLAALQAAADLLERVGRDQTAEQIKKTVQNDTPKIEDQAWLSDHYAVCIDRTVFGIRDVWTGQISPYVAMPGWDDYSIYTGNGLLWPAMTDQPTLLKPDRLRQDLFNAARETMGHYGCSHTSGQTESVWVSQNIWRDHLVRYVSGTGKAWDQQYWDLQVVSNTHQQSLGYCDTYINHKLSFSPLGITSFGYLLTYPRLMIDRLAAEGPVISVTPDRHAPQRWPLLPLADWKAGKIPICVVDTRGQVTIEGESDPVAIREHDAQNTKVSG